MRSIALSSSNRDLTTFKERQEAPPIENNPIACHIPIRGWGATGDVNVAVKLKMLCVAALKYRVAVAGLPENDIQIRPRHNR